MQVVAINFIDAPVNASAINSFNGQSHTQSGRWLLKIATFEEDVKIVRKGESRCV